MDNEVNTTQKKKSHVGLIILLVILVICLCGGSFYLGHILFKDSGTTSNVKEEVKAVGKIDDSKEIVYTKDTQTFKSENGKYTNTYELPYININSDFAKSINEELSKIYDEHIKINEDENDYDTKKYMMYKFYENNEILSLVVVEFDGLGPDLYNVYNINEKTGEEVSLNDLLDIVNINSDEFNVMDYYSKALISDNDSNGMNNYFDQLRPNEYSTEDINSLYEILENNIEWMYDSFIKDLITQDFNYFLVDGKLMIAGEFPCNADQGVSAGIFDTDGNITWALETFNITE